MTDKKGGVIPYHIQDGQIEMLFMVPSDAKYGGTSFQIAKGLVEHNEDIKEGAFREAEEELGLFMPNVIEEHELGSFSQVGFWIAKIKDKDQFGEPHYETGDTKWMTAEQFENEGRTIHRPVVKAAIRLIERHETIE
jgi:8-oxo-dGTP pyrophosphatase MutT (NUDIX family)